jgi:hypothetical protein
MKSLLVPAAIAIGGLFVVSHLERTDSLKEGCSSISKNDHARHNRHIQKNDKATSFNEVPANAIQVANFAPLTEITAASFLIDFSDAQIALSDLEMNNQMNEDLVEISVPETEDADAEMNENFTAK